MSIVSALCLRQLGFKNSVIVRTPLKDNDHFHWLLSKLLGSFLAKFISVKAIPSACTGLEQSQQLATTENKAFMIYIAHPYCFHESGKGVLCIPHLHHEYIYIPLLQPVL